MIARLCRQLVYPRLKGPYGVFIRVVNNSSDCYASFLGQGGVALLFKILEEGMDFRLTIGVRAQFVEEAAPRFPGGTRIRASSCLLQGIWV